MSTRLRYKADMTEQDVIRLLVQACAKAGGQAPWAKQAGVSQAYINDVVNGRRLPGPSVLNALGLERVVTYRRKERKDG